MSKGDRSNWVCSECNYQSAKWLGKCSDCGVRNTMVEIAQSTSRNIAGVKSQGRITTPSTPTPNVSSIKMGTQTHIPTGISEVDRVLGGGLVKGGVILLAGEPGAGKSTLSASLAHKFAEKYGKKVLIVSSEESAEQIALRAHRIHALSENLFIASEVELSATLGRIYDVNPEFLIVDSLQTMASEDIEARAGSVSQVIEVATVLTRLAKERNIPLILIGQVTKEGSIAGPRVVEHLVDTVLHFEGESDSTLRILRGIKNRYGPSDEIGCFEHSDIGMVEVPDPSGLFISRRDEDIAGVVTTVVLEGRRAIPVEIQSLVAPTNLPMPRRVITGLEANRSMMVQAIVERYGKTRLGDRDIFVSTVGGIRTKEPVVDLAMAVALDSSANDYKVPRTLIVLGEVALSGEVRAVTGIQRRMNEASRLGFTEVMVPAGAKLSEVKGMSIIRVGTVPEALNRLRPRN